MTAADGESPGPAGAVAARGPWRARGPLHALVFLLAFPGQAAAGEADTGEPGRIERFHRRISADVVRLADRIDAFLGDDRIGEESRRSYIRLRTDADHDGADGSTTVGANVNARVHLPGARRLLSLVFAGDGDEDEGPAARDDDDEVAGLRGDAEGSVAVRYHPRHRPAGAFSLDFGARRKEGGYRVFTRVRARRAFGGTAGWAGRLSNKLYYFDGPGFENQLRLDFERPLGRHWLFRAQSEIEWFENEDGVFPEQHFILVHQPGPGRVMAWEWRNFFSTRPVTRLDESQFRVRYRQNLDWNWLFLEARPILAFPHDSDYEATWRFRLRLEAYFGAT